MIDLGKLAGKIVASPITVPVEAVKTATAEIDRALSGRKEK